MFNLDPTRPHNLSLQNQKLEGSRISAKDLRDVLTTSGHGDDGLYKDIRNVNTERMCANHENHKPLLTIGSLLLAHPYPQKRNSA